MEPVNEREIESHIRYLSDDLLEGRAVGSKGIGMAELYVEDLFRTFGLEAPIESTYRQSFLLKAALPDPNPFLEFSNSRGKIAPVPNQDFVIHSEREDLPEETTEISSIAAISSRRRRDPGMTSRAWIYGARFFSAKSTSRGTFPAACSTARR